MTANFPRFRRFPRFLGAATGMLVLLASGQVFASIVVVAPVPVYARPPVVVTAAPRVVVAKPAPKVVVAKPAPKVVVASAPLPTVVVRATPVPRNVYVASRSLYMVR